MTAHGLRKALSGLQEVPEVTLPLHSSFLLWNFLHRWALGSSASEMSLLTL